MVYFANYAMNEGIFINIDKNGCPVSVFIDGASDILNVKKKFWKNLILKSGLAVMIVQYILIFL